MWLLQGMALPVVGRPPPTSIKPTKVIPHSCVLRWATQVILDSVHVRKDTTERFCGVCLKMKEFRIPRRTNFSGVKVPD